ncbi:hypothetical protein ACFRDV_22245 [Streptomyces fagopyri]|uniref:hypothetical protein n=1 Tax=Streptomyces fagopyri TaxID=2662397 RepID=UPI0036A3D668
MDPEVLMGIILGVVGDAVARKTVKKTLARITKIATPFVEGIVEANLKKSWDGAAGTHGMTTAATEATSATGAAIPPVPYARTEGDGTWQSVR